MPQAELRDQTTPFQTQDQETSLIVRRSLHDELCERLRTIIINGDLEPGEKIPEKDLCQHFGVSRTPLREALKVLASEGLLTLAPNRGAIVSRLTLADLEETFPVMGALEALSGEMACALITDSELAEIRAIHEQMIGHFKRRERMDYFRLNQQIHEKILLAARNQTLSNCYRALAGRIRHARYLANMSDERWTRAAAEHDEIIALLEARNGAKLARLLKKHLAGKYETLREGLLAQNIDQA